MAAQSKATQFTVRGVSPRLERALRERARREGQSLNTVLLEALAAGAGLVRESAVHEDLDDLIGTWVEDPAFDEALRAQDQVDPQAWE